MRDTGKEQRLVGEGAELRRHDRSNYPLYARWYSDEEVWRLTSWTSEPMRQASVERLFEDRQNSPKDDSFAIHREGEEKPLGVISLMNISEADASADLSIIVGEKENRDQGLGTEAIRLVLRYAFEDQGLSRIALSVFEFNEPAMRSYEKLGFRREGRIERAVHRDGEWQDAILMRVLASEWREQDDTG